MKSNIFSHINFGSVMKAIRRGGKKHLPEILAGLGVAGYFTTTVVTVKVAPVARAKIEEARKEKEKYAADDEEVKITPVEAVKIVWKDYLPVAIGFVCSTACIVGASATNMKRNAALAAAYSLAETSLQDYKKKIPEIVGEKKAEEIKDAVMKEELHNTPVAEGRVINTGYGNSLCFDVVSGRYFYSTKEKLCQAANEINRRMRDEIMMCANDFYREIGLDEIAVGYDIGWNIDKGYIDLEFSSQLTPEGLAFVPAGLPCLVMRFNINPHYEYT